MIARLDHIQLAMPPGREDDARSFFAGILGMIEQTKPEPLASRGGCWFEAGSAIVHLGVERDFSPQRKAHPAFCVSDIHSLAAVLQQNNQGIQWDEAFSDRRRFYTMDPFGNRIEFIQSGDGFTER
ncbi:MAG: glyoxalase [Alphaproteobacteria bacterium]|nr:MAG: glyoxalase [Alphaproteobacteria bacterium]